MSHDREGWRASFEETQTRQMLLGLQMTRPERLRWLDGRRAELQRLSRAVKTPPGEPGFERFSGETDP